MKFRILLVAMIWLSHAPIAVYLRGFGQIRFRGDEQHVHGLVRAMLAQLATAHAPGEVQIALCTTGDRREAWDWLKWLPHNQSPDSRDAAGSRRLIAESIGAMEELLGGGTFTSRPRFEPDTPITANEPFVVIVLDGVQLPPDHRAGDEGYRNAVVLDVGESLPWQAKPGADRKGTGYAPSRSIP